MLKMRKLLIIMSSVAIVAACSTPANIAYFQDTEEAEGAQIAQIREIILQPGDVISIVVNAKTNELSALFNLPYTARRIGQSSDNSISGTSGSQMSGYTIAQDGTIDFPTLGRLKVAGMTKQQVAKMIKDELRLQGQANETVVTVEFMNLTYEVLGEVSRPGRYSISKDGMTILEALATAGDLGIQGKRDNVMVLRNEDGKQRTYTIDLCSTRSIISSPAYYLQQNDVIYVEPNDLRKRQSKVNGNNVRNASFWMSLGTFATTMILAVQRISKYM